MAVLAAFTAKAGETFTYKDPATGIELKYEWIGDPVDGGTVRTAPMEDFTVEMREDCSKQWVWHPELGQYGETVEEEVCNTSIDWSKSKIQSGPNAKNYDGLSLRIPETVSDAQGRKATVVEIGKASFACSEKILELVIPETITKIGDFAFYGVSNSQKAHVTILNGLQDFGEGVFLNFNDLRHLTIGGKVKYIPEKAFYKHPNLNFVTITGDVEIIGAYAFAGNGQMNDPCEIDGEAALTFKEPCNVKVIEEGAFKDCDIKAIRFPDSLDSIGTSAFTGNPNLNNLDFGNGTRYIGEGAFQGSQIHNIKFSDKLETIAENAFRGCKNLDNIEWGNSLKSIGDHAFAAPNTLNGAIKFPDSLEEIGEGAFEGCINISSSGGQEIVYGNGIKTIGDNAYRGCNIQNLTLSASVEKIGKGAYQLSDPTFREMSCYATIPPYIEGEDEMGVYKDDDVFNQFIYENTCLHVPIGAYEAYATAPGWKKFKCIIADLVVPEAPMDQLIDYLFLIPNEKANLTSYFYRPDEVDSNLLTWEIESNGEQGQPDVINLDNAKTGDITALNFGQAILKAYRITDEIVGGDKYNPEHQTRERFSACVVVFVCPTMTVVYNTDGGDNGIIRKAPAMMRGNAAEAETLTQKYATYEHRVIYNSLPKVKVESAEGYEIDVEAIKHIDLGSVEDKNVASDLLGGELKNVVDENAAAELVDDKYIVPVDPIQDNQVIEIPVAMYAAGTVGVKEVEITSEITVNVIGKQITINGAAPEDVVLVYNTDGQLIYRSTTKSFEINAKGVYITKVGDAAFKIMIH